MSFAKKLIRSIGRVATIVSVIVTLGTVIAPQKAEAGVRGFAFDYALGKLADCAIDEGCRDYVVNSAENGRRNISYYGTNEAAASFGEGITRWAGYNY